MNRLEKRAAYSISLLVSHSKAAMLNIFSQFFLPEMVLKQGTAKRRAPRRDL